MRDADEVARLGMAVLNWLELDSHARLIVGEKCEIRWCNPAAAELIAAQLGLEARGQVLTATDTACQAKLKSLLQEARQQPASICIEQLHEGWLVLRCVAVAVPKSADLLFCISVSRAGDGGVWTFDHLAECFDLTPTEHRVLQDLLAGHEAETLSSRNAVSIETTRTHIKSIYAKVGVKTREALFARLRGFRA